MEPLLGPSAASAVFGPQKGAATADVAKLESALTVGSSSLSAPASRAGAGSSAGEPVRHTRPHGRVPRTPYRSVVVTVCRWDGVSSTAMATGFSWSRFIPDVEVRIMGQRVVRLPRADRGAAR